MALRARRRRIEGASEGGNSLRLLNLSLFIMLLAFFLVLNGISSYEEVKYRPILQNLQMTFSTVQREEGDGPSMAPSSEQSFNEGATVDRIDALFNAQITGFKTQKLQDEGVMTTSIPREEFDRAMTTMGQVDLTKVKTVTGLQTYFVPTLVSLMLSAEKGRPYRMDLVLHTQGDPAALMNEKPAILRDLIAQASTYAAILTKAGLPETLVNIAVEQGDPQTVTLYFRPQAGTP